MLSLFLSKSIFEPRRFTHIALFNICYQERQSLTHILLRIFLSIPLMHIADTFIVKTCCLEDFIILYVRNHSSSPCSRADLNHFNLKCWNFERSLTSFTCVFYYHLAVQKTTRNVLKLKNASSPDFPVLFTFYDCYFYVRKTKTY